jgi:hypothetical protein
MSGSLIWWEKTVEYQFVIQSTNAGFDLAAPLSGLQERGGDAVFGSDSRLILIEFKRSVDDLGTEEKKFAGRFIEAKESLQPGGAHHFLIYGSLLDHSLLLSYVGYWSAKSAPTQLANQTTFNTLKLAGISKAMFDAYLEKLIAFKPADKRGSGSGGISFGHVLGVDPTTGKCACIALDEYHRTHAPMLELDQSLDMDMDMDTPSGSRYGM